MTGLVQGQPTVRCENVRGSSVSRIADSVFAFWGFAGTNFHALGFHTIRGQNFENLGQVPVSRFFTDCKS